MRAFRKPATWGAYKALCVASSCGGTLDISWQWRFDQRRGLCRGLARRGLLRRIRTRPGSDVFAITPEGKVWLRAERDRRLTERLLG